MLKNEPNKAFYGPKHVALAVESEAVETLLICDKLFRARGVAERRKYVEMVDKVRGFFCPIFLAQLLPIFCCPQFFLPKVREVGGEWISPILASLIFHRFLLSHGCSMA